ncbi:RHS repeat-associated core domain-containing protein, partial [Escherichia coli]|uniref:RHS repeat-associated core domain-containing protein n=1 Tax=Escherichia coli TaxID=562 RepID=UPI002FC6F048
IVWETGYQVWGNTIQEKDHGGVEQNLRYQGQYLDRETGLHYNLHRYYDPDVGRFMVTDPIGLRGGLNLYAYAPNPLSWIDPFGLSGVGIPYGFKSYGQFNQFGQTLQAGMSKLGYPGAVSYMQGSSVSGVSRERSSEVHFLY